MALGCCWRSWSTPSCAADVLPGAFCSRRRLVAAITVLFIFLLQPDGLFHACAPRWASTRSSRRSRVQREPDWLGNVSTALGSIMVLNI
jgi:hypothetical protein